MDADSAQVRAEAVETVTVLIVTDAMDDFEDDDYERDPMGATEALRLANWLNGQPAGAVVPWGDIHVMLAPGVHRASWIDVTIEQACEDLKTSWCWTVVTPEDDDNDGTAWPDKASLTLVVKPDVTVHVAYDPSKRWFDTDGPVAVTTIGADADPAQMAAVEAHATQLGGEVIVQEGWSNEAVNDALAAWTAQLTGRTDISFAFDDAIGRERVDAIREAADIDAEQCIDLGDNILASPGAMDQLLEMGPDVAADITRTLKNIVNRDTDGPGLRLGR